MGVSTCEEVQSGSNHVYKSVRAYHSSRNVTVVITMSTDQMATASICSRLFLGTLAGTKLAKSGSVPRRQLQRITHSMFACSAATGRNGVVVNFESLSFNEDADKLREAAESARPGSMSGETW